MSEPRSHLHPIYELAERSLSLGPARRGRLAYAKEATPSLSPHQCVRLTLRIDLFVIERQLYKVDRQIRVAQVRYRLAELDGEAPDGFFPQSRYSDYATIETMLGETRGEEYELGLMRFVRESAHLVPDPAEFLAFLDAEVLRAELATRGARHPCPERFVGAVPAFRAPGTWLYRSASTFLLLLHAGEHVFVVEGTEDETLASIPDAHFAAAVAVLRP